MKYLIKVNGCVVGVEVLTAEDVRRYTGVTEITLERI